ncbi:M48 family metallopeptidase [Algirhabdus cladophorae]|uniref:M48 family metallopeptidase n=1 Tax=Algirhabdus cladophorae TaxID=3377108 RepID=UPI003B845E28
MEEIILDGSPPIAVVLRRSARAGRISLRVSRLDGRVSLTIPTRGSKSEAISFLREKEVWLRHQLVIQAPRVDLRVGAEVLFEGTPLVISQGKSRAAQIIGTQLLVPGPEAGYAAKIAAFLKARARPRLHAATEVYAARLGKPVKRITLRDTRSRWGSCSSAGNLNYSWRLIMAPPDVLDYVAAHEVAHLQEMNHSQAFWDVVERLYGPCADQRKWLRTNGNLLHQYVFD